MAIFTVGIIGAGFLGKCIAIDLSMNNVQVIVVDKDAANVSAEVFQKSSYALLQPMWRIGFIPEEFVRSSSQNIKLTTSLQDLADVNVVIECLPENPELKVNILKQVESICSPQTILGTSTINIEVNEISKYLSRPQNFLGIRFFYPCVLIPEIEITPGNSTQFEIVQSIIEFFKQINKNCHRGPTKFVLSRNDVIALQEETSKNLRYFHGADGHGKGKMSLPKFPTAAGPLLTQKPLEPIGKK